MKKLKVLAIFTCLLFSTLTASAQSPNYSGEWELDLKKTKLAENSGIESMTMNVVHGDDRLTVESKIKRGNADEMQAVLSAPDLAFYPLDGAEARMQRPASGKMLRTQWILRGTVEKDGNLKLMSLLSAEQSGEMIRKTSEDWKILDGGKTLKILRETETPRGVLTDEMYFTKTGTGITGVRAMRIPRTEGALAGSGGGRFLSRGVVNGKALRLIKPAYPKEARKAKAQGTVEVQVLIDEWGNVIGAKATSGHPLLLTVSEEAARLCKFSPTKIEGVAVKVSGVIVYTFTRQ